MSEVIVIAGPTASGKSAAALSVASVLDGEIINADAMQVYDTLSVLTARPQAEDLACAPHHLYGVSPPTDIWSAGRFARTAAQVIEDVLARGRRPIIVGGTGLWLKALTQGLSPMPDVGDEIMEAARARLVHVGLSGLRADVLAVDPELAWIDPADTQRHLRAWTVFEATGRPLSIWQAAPPQKVSLRTFWPVVLCPPREELYRRCNDRFVAMMQAGAADEVAALLAMNVAETAPAMKSLGVPEISAWLRGDLSREEAIARAQMATRRLAKRQMTWFRGQARDWPILREISADDFSL